MKDKDELDDLFDFGSNENDLIKKAKRKSTIRMVGTSGLVSLLVLALIILIKMQVTPWLLNKELIEQETYYEVYGANMFVGPWDESIQLLGSSATAPKYKLLNGRPVYIGEVSNDSDRFEVHLSPNAYETYRYSGGKVMNFVHPGLEIDQVPNELEQLDEAGENQLIEMGLSFDASYTLSEVKAMLPSEVSLQWAWVDVFTDEEVASWETPEPSANVLRESEVVGFSMVDETGILLEEPVEKFMESVTYGKDHAGTYKEEMGMLHDRLSGQAEANIKIIGAVVVGEKAALQQLQNESGIRASSRGAIVDAFN